MNCFLGIDSGTSGVKAVVMAEDGCMLGVGYKEISLITPQPMWVEQDPEEWWRAAVYAIKEAVSKSGCGSDIRAIGLTGQMLGSTLLDKNLKSLGNCMIWLDQRAVEETEYIKNTIGMEKLLDITCNYPLTGYWASKLMWIKNNRPDVFEKIGTVLFTKDYLRFRLTGELSVEVSDATGSYLFDVRKRTWSEEMFKACGIPFDIAPKKVYESTEIAGYLLESLAEEFGIKAGIPVIAGGGDQTAGGVGNGIVREGVISATIGTSGVVFACSDKPIADEQPRAALSFCHSVPGKWSLFGCTLSAGGSLKWLRDTLFSKERDSMAEEGKDVFKYMDSLAKEAAPGSEGLIFLPYLNGERTPYPDPNARGTFFGLSFRHSLKEITRSVMEGVTFSLRDTIEILKEYGVEVKEVRASGGGAKSALWKQIQADIFNATVVTTNAEEGPSVGAAILAAVGSGYYKNVEEACDATIKIVSTTEPDSRNVLIYEDFYESYRALYSILKDRFAIQAKKVAKWL